MLKCATQINYGDNSSSLTLTFCCWWDIFRSYVQLMVQWMCNTKTPTVIPAVGIHHSRLGKSLLHIPQWEYHQHMTRAPLTLSHLACCLPLQPLHTESDCVCAHVCHRQQPLTRNTTGLREKRSGRAEILGDLSDGWGWGGGAAEHACVKRLCHQCDGMIDGEVFCAKRAFPSLPPLFFSITQIINFSQEKPLVLSWRLS